MISLIVSMLLLAQIAQSADPPHVLTERERAEWNQWGQQEQEIGRRYDAAILAAVNTAVGDLSRDVHGAIQQAWLSRELIRARRDAWLGQLRADHVCRDCVIDNGKLVKPPAK